ncbi:MAG TPA: DUF2278 family protein [Longimicrobium sp.]|nr:DUF2278 family protein [Longimicrobium sp.]
MGIRNYGVLKGRIDECRQERDDRAPHYEIHARAAAQDFRVSINVLSSDPGRPELLAFVDDDFRHPITQRLAGLDEGYHRADRQYGLAVDYVRGGMVDRERMRVIPHDRPGADNDLNDKLHALLRRAIDDPDVEVYAFGSRWGPEHRDRDAVFRFLPGNGVHDIHMNQGTPERSHHARDNGVWQDGALFVHFRDEGRWAAVFLAFQTQSWETDDTTGHPRAGDRSEHGRRGHDDRQPAGRHDPRHSPPREARPAPKRVKVGEGVRIVAAEINPAGDDRGLETVTLHNTSPRPVSIHGWAIDNGEDARHPLEGVLAPDARLVVRLPVDVALGNRGGVIALLDATGRPVDGVTYTRDHARDEGRLVRF